MWTGGGNLHNPQKAMTSELTLDQLQSVSGTGTETHWNQKLRNAKGFYNIKQLANTGKLVKK